MPKRLIDDALWARIEPLLPKLPSRRFKNMGRPRVPDRAALTGISFVLPWQMLPKIWAVESAAPAGVGSCAGSERACGVASTPCCWRNCASAASSISLGRSSTVPRSGRCAGEKPWTEPNRSPSGGVETSHSHRGARHSPGRHCDRHQPARREPVDLVGGEHAAAARPSRRSGAQTGPDSRRSRL